MRPSIGGFVSAQPAAFAAWTRSVIRCWGGRRGVGYESSTWTPLVPLLLEPPPPARPRCDRSRRIAATTRIVPTMIAVACGAFAAAAASACSRAMPLLAALLFFSLRLDTGPQVSRPVTRRSGLRSAVGLARADLPAVSRPERSVEADVRRRRRRARRPRRRARAGAGGALGRRPGGARPRRRPARVGRHRRRRGWTSAASGSARRRTGSQALARELGARDLSHLGGRREPDRARAGAIRYTGTIPRLART